MRDPEDVAYIAQLHAELAAAKAEVERLTPKAKLTQSIIDRLPLCSDHRDKQNGKDCLVCANERLRALCAKFMDCWRNDWMSKEEEAEFDAAGRGEETK